jgi:hypothetical protein
MWTIIVTFFIKCSEGSRDFRWDRGYLWALILQSAHRAPVHDANAVIPLLFHNCNFRGEKVELKRVVIMATHSTCGSDFSDSQHRFVGYCFF